MKRHDKIVYKYYSSFDQEAIIKEISKANSAHVQRNVKQKEPFFCHTSEEIKSELPFSSAECNNSDNTSLPVLLQFISWIRQLV